MQHVLGIYQNRGLIATRRRRRIALSGAQLYDRRFASFRTIRDERWNSVFTMG